MFFLFFVFFFFFFNDTATTEIYTLSLHDALPISGHGGSLNHLGVEVPDIDTVDAEQTRLAETGLASVDERATTCCYAKQDKFWVQGAPDGEHWEIYTVLADSQTFYDHDHDGPECCGAGAHASGEQATSAAGCC